MGRFDLAKLYKHRILIELPSDGEAPIKIWAHPPTVEEISAASMDAGLSVDDGGRFNVEDANKLQLNISSAQVQYHLARYCVDAIEGLDGWPTTPKHKGPNGLPVLTDEAMDAIGRGEGGEVDFGLQYAVLVHVGEKLADESKVGEEEGNGSAPSPSGASTGSSTEATTAVTGEGSPIATGAPTPSGQGPASSGAATAAAEATPPEGSSTTSTA